MNKLKKPLAVQAAMMVVCLLSVSISDAEVRTITATGEYRMGDNDTRTDAKRLALLDAKRLALEQAGTYIESITQVKNFDLSKEEIRAYTAGIVELIEQETRSTMEGQQQIVRVDVIAKIDTNVVTRQIDALRKNEKVKADLLRTQQEADRLRRERDALQQELAAAKTKPEVEALAQKRREVFTRADVVFLLAQAAVALGASSGGLKPGSSSAAGRARARSLIEQALALAPSEPLAHVWMGNLLYEEGDLDGTIAAYGTALRLNPDDATTHNNLAFVLMTKGVALQVKRDLDGAIAAYRTALRLKLDEPAYYLALHLALGNALQAKGDLDGAIAELRTALRLKPDDAVPHNHLASALEEKGDLNGAITEYRTALRLDPKDSFYVFGLGHALRAKGDLDSAITEYREFLRLNPDDAFIREELGSSLLDKGNLDEAITELREVLRLEPKYVMGRYHLGQALQAKGRRQEAAREFREYLRLVPDEPHNREIERARAALRELER